MIFLNLTVGEIMLVRSQGVAGDVDSSCRWRVE